ncbi:hypothetical protein LCGC14_1984120 [marine sediment metagenome]|uniref:Uncharacterized protein n=1 Tax=marine sediment metagenome TaxID=412755 RepID=A0A0F9F889_9ZZZZ
MNSKKLISKTVLNSLPAVQFNELFQDVSRIINKLKTRYTLNFSLQEFIDTDYTSLFQNRVSALTKPYPDLNYEDLNRDKLLREFRDKKDYKIKIIEKLQEIGKKYGLSEYDITLNLISLILEADSKKQDVNLSYGELLSEFEPFYNELMAIFNFPSSPELKLECYDLFQNIHNKLKVERFYKNLKKLSPVVIFMFLKMKGYNITMKNLIHQIKLDEREVRRLFRRSIEVYPEYLKKNRKLIVQNQIRSIKDTFQFSEEFGRTSEAILDKFWMLLGSTTESVVAGTVCILTMIVMDIKNHPISEICDSLGFTQSAVNYQIKNKIFEKLHIPGFKTITSSRELIKELIKKNIDIKKTKT